MFVVVGFGLWLVVLVLCTVFEADRLGLGLGLEGL